MATYKTVQGPDGGLYALYPDGSSERLYESSLGQFGGAPALLTKAEADAIAGQSFANSSDPSAATFMETPTYTPAIYRDPGHEWWQDALPAAWLGGFGGAAIGAAGAAEGAGGTAGATSAEVGAGDMFGSGAAWEGGSAGLGEAGAAGATGLGAITPTSGDSPGTSGVAAGGAASGGGSEATGLFGLNPDTLRTAGTLGSAALGYLGAERQGARLENLAREYMALGAPSRARFEGSFAPDFDVSKLPGVQPAIDTASEALLRKLSAKGGNPWGDPGGLTEAQNFIVGNIALPTLNEYRRLNAGAGGLAALTGAAPGASMGSIAAEGGKYDAVGGALADLTRPRRSFGDVMRELQWSLA